MFFFDPQLALWINDTPLLISGRVVEAARALGIGDLKWNKDGFVCGVDHETSMKLAEAIGSVTLSVAEYMQLARREPRVSSDTFAEWLTDTYGLDNGKRVSVHNSSTYSPVARPGWFDLDDIDDTGLPTVLTQHSGMDRWKFWTLGHADLTSGAMRSYVTSSGTCSLALGIPVFARHQNVMIREAYRGGPPPVCVSPLETLWQKYQSMLEAERPDKVAMHALLQSITDDGLRSSEKVDSLLAENHAEIRYDLLGKQRILRNDYSGLEMVDIDDIQEVLAKARTGAIGVVLGHPHPDAGSIVSSTLEAARRSLLSPDRAYIAWTDHIPAEVAKMVGSVLAAELRRPVPDNVHEAVIVDCQATADLQPQWLVKAVIDHHLATETYPYYVARSEEVG